MHRIPADPVISLRQYHTIPSRSSSVCMLIDDDIHIQTDGCLETDVRVETEASKNEGEPGTERQTLCSDSAELT